MSKESSDLSSMCESSKFETTCWTACGGERWVDHDGPSHTVTDLEVIPWGGTEGQDPEHCTTVG